MKKLLISLLLAASLLLCLTAVSAENADVPQRLEDLPILQKSQKPANFSYTYEVVDQSLTIVTENLPENWNVVPIIDTGYEKYREYGITTEDHHTWSMIIPDYYIEDNGVFWGILIRHYDAATGVTEELTYDTALNLAGWYLQDDTTYTTLDFTGTMYIFYADDTGENRFYYDLDGELKEKLHDPIVTYQDNEVYDYLDLFLDEPKNLNVNVPSAETILYRLSNEDGDILATNTVSGDQLSLDLAPYLQAEGMYSLHFSAEKAGVIGSYANIELMLKSLAVVESGVCGDNVTWELTNKYVLTISGTGAMDNFSDETAPWYQYAMDDAIEKIVVEAGVTSIGDYAFTNSGMIMSITLPSGITTIGDYAFANC